MGCGASSEEVATVATFDEKEAAKWKFVPVPDCKMPNAGIAANARPVRTSEELLKQIRTSNGIVYATVAPEEQVNCLFFFNEFAQADQPPCQFVRAVMQPTPGEELPAWESLRLQFKEFDSVDDVRKPWKEGTNIPGIMACEPAGPTASWCVVCPHSYQHRWVMPNAQRASCFDDDLESIPIRLWERYSKKDEAGNEGKDSEMIRLYVQCMNESIKQEKRAEKKKAKKDAGDDSELTEEEKAECNVDTFNVDEIAPILEGEMSADKAGAYNTVWQLTDALGDFRQRMSGIEDSLLYNWFEIAVESDTDVDTWYYERSDAACEPQNVGGFHTRLVKKAVKSAEEGCDDALNYAKGKMKDATIKMVQTMMGGGPEDDDDTDADKEFKAKANTLVEELYADMDEIVSTNVKSIDAELVGLNHELPANDGDINDGSAQQKLDAMRTSDNRPLPERREELWAVVKKEHEDTMAQVDACGTFEEKAKHYEAMSQRMRVPRRVARHFFKFNFYLVFPLMKDSGTFRKPNNAKLVIWVERAPGTKQEIEMQELRMPNGGEDQVDENVDKATGMANDGDDSVSDNADSDPRANWSNYDSKDFRGYWCQAEVAVDCLAYAYHFELDGRQFIDNDSFFSKDDEEAKVYYRRVRFSAAARIFTVNPLKQTGLAL